MNLEIKRDFYLMNMTFPYKVYIDGEIHKIHNGETLNLELEDKIYTCYVKLFYITTKKVEIDLTRSNKTLAITPVFNNTLIITAIILFFGSFVIMGIDDTLIEMVINVITVLAAFYFLSILYYSTLGYKNYLKLKVL